MRSSSKKLVLSADEIGNHIKEHGHIEFPQKPYVYLPDIQVTGYEFDELDSKSACIPFGLNQNDKKYLPNSAFVFVNNSGTNALSTSIKDVPIVGLYLGSISEIEHNANLMIGTMFEENFPAGEFKRNMVYIDADGLLTLENKDCFLSYKDERIMSYMIAETALRFIILHEIGHHYHGHITNLSNEYKGFILLKANDETDIRLEMEADAFASQTLAQEFALVLREFMKHNEDLTEFSVEEIELIALNTMITAMTLPFSILYQPNDDKELKTTESIVYREMSALINLSSALFKNKTCRKAAIYDICSKTNEELEENNNMLSKRIDFERIKATQKIDYYDFYNYILIMFIESKQLFYKVNQILHIDIYLDNYIKTLDSLSSKGKN